MIATRTLASAALVALGAFSGRSAAAATPSALAAHREEGAVTALGVISSERTTDVLIRVSGAITFNHFTLSQPDKIVVDRPNARRHLAFGHGIHRCVGARLAELQISVLLEEMAARRMRVNVVGAPTRVSACFVHGYRKLPVEISKY